MSSFDDGSAGEEAWEVEIGALLGGLPAVEPPDGFIAAALDHRPLYAGRIMTALLAVVLMVVMAGLVAGAGPGSLLVAPEVDQLTRRHLQAQAGLAGDSNQASNATAAPDSLPGTDSYATMPMPDGFERAATIAADDLRQAIYARGGESVSVFVQEGEVDWAALPVQGLTSVDGNMAWIDAEREVTVVQAGDETVTIVGLPSGEVADLVSTLPDESGTVLDRAGDLAASVVAHLGFSTE